MKTTRTTRELLGTIWLFSDLDDRELTQLASLASQRLVKAGTAVVHQGDTDGDLYAVANGHLKVSATSSDGREVVLNLMRPGDVFGEIALLDGQARSAAVTAIDDSELVVVRRAQFLELLQKKPSIATKLLQALARLVRRQSERAEDRAFLGVRERLAKQLLELSKTCGVVLAPNEIALSINLSQQELGDMVEATRESVNKCLREWIRHGIMRRSSRRLIIQDQSRLEALVGR